MANRRDQKDDFLTEIIAQARLQNVPVGDLDSALRENSPLVQMVLQFVNPRGGSPGDIDFVSVASLISQLRHAAQWQKAGLRYDVLLSLISALRNFMDEFFPEGFEAGVMDDWRDFVVRVGLDRKMEKNELEKLQKEKMIALDMR